MCNNHYVIICLHRKGAYWPWQSAATGFEQSCGNTSIAKSMNPKSKSDTAGCYWMHEVHIGCDIAMFFRMNWWRKGNTTWLLEDAWQVKQALPRPPKKNKPKKQTNKPPKREYPTGISFAPNIGVSSFSVSLCNPDSCVLQIQ